MKLRTDFVSNSSSCSFIVRNPVGCVQKFADILGMSVQDVIDDLARNYVSDLSEIAVYVFNNDKEWDRDSMTFLDFLETYADAKNPLNAENIVEFECDDYEAEKRTMLRYLYNAFKKCGYNVDAESTEHEFLYETSSTVTERLSKLA